MVLRLTFTIKVAYDADLAWLFVLIWGLKRVAPSSQPIGCRAALEFGVSNFCNWTFAMVSRWASMDNLAFESYKLPLWIFCDSCDDTTMFNIYKWCRGLWREQYVEFASEPRRRPCAIKNVAWCGTLHRSGWGGHVQLIMWHGVSSYCF